MQVADTWSQGKLPEERSFELKWTAQAERRGEDVLLLDRKILYRTQGCAERRPV